MGAARLVALGAGPSPSHEEARRFCLAVIREFYGFDYRADWHADLDALAMGGDSNPYAPHRGGAFVLLRDAAGDLIGTAGIHRLSWKPALATRLAARYPEPDAVGMVARVYVRRDRRGGGEGSRLLAAIEASAPMLGFATLYLHANTDSAATMAFWRRRGYRDFGTLDFSTHFDKSLWRGGDVSAQVSTPCAD